MGSSLQDRISLGAVSIFLPTASNPNFGISEDLAGLFGLDFNIDAAAKFLEAFRNLHSDMKRKLRLDREADAVSLSARKADVILAAALVINDLVALPNRRPLTTEEIEAVAWTLKSWKRPKPQPWHKGDVFLLPLLDNTFTFGQVLDAGGHATCALFDARSPQPDVVADNVVRMPLITILHLTHELLDEGRWKVIGSAQVRLDCNSGPGGRDGEVGSTSYSAGILEKLAEAYYGLSPWNIYHQEDYLDERLMPGLRRPTQAHVLSTEERRAYRMKHFGRE